MRGKGKEGKREGNSKGKQQVQNKRKEKINQRGYPFVVD